ncbi:MAG: carbohydrate binding domain-containing protein [Ktedonobacterales bacterium]|nr:carbohydrate binding domain-containing protein [Ktedonobacterales bacterium]
MAWWKPVSLVASAFVLLTLLRAAPAEAASFGWSVGPNVSVPWQHVDIAPGIVREPGQISVIYSDGSTWQAGSTYSGWTLLRGPSLDHLQVVAHPTLHGRTDLLRGFGMKTWIGTVIPTADGWYGVTHSEFQYHATSAYWFNWFRKLGIARSRDHGLTWDYLGDIATSPNSTNIADYAQWNYFDAGPGDPHFFADWATGYAYVYYTAFWANKTTAERYGGTRVARCPLTQLGNPGCWVKWYAGGWSQPGIGGKDSDVWQGGDSPTVFYSQGLQRYVAISRTMNEATTIATATDLSQQNWTVRENFCVQSVTGCDVGQLLWYNWVADATTGDPYVITHNFRLYSAQNGATAKYMTVTLAPGAASSPGIANDIPYYPYQSVPDFNPGYQRNTPDFYPRNHLNPFDPPLASWQDIANLDWAHNGAWGGTSYLDATLAGAGNLFGYDPAMDMGSTAAQEQDGEIDLHLNLQKGNRVGIVFQAVGGSPGQYTMIYYDNGTWGYFGVAGKYVPFAQGWMAPQQWHLVAVTLDADHIIVSVDGASIANLVVPMGTFRTNAGYAGLRMWSEGAAQEVWVKDMAVMSTYGRPYQNLIFNPGFDNNPQLPTDWQTWPAYWPNAWPANPGIYHMAPVAACQRDGGSGLQMTPSNQSQSAEQVVRVQPNTTYTLSGYLRAASGSPAIYLGAKDGNGWEVNSTTRAAAWQQVVLVFTTGPHTTQLRVYVWMPQQTGAGCADDLWLQSGPHALPPPWQYPGKAPVKQS